MLSMVVLAAVLAQAPAQTATTSPPPRVETAAAYVPQRVFDTRKKAFTDFEAMLADLARADVVLVGEQHDDPNTHRLEAAVLQGLLRRGTSLTLSLEMFERDAQAPLDGYLAGTMTEDEFLKASRPWPRYASDYRPMVEMARMHRWPVVAANVPRRLASDVSKSGKDALDRLPAEDQAFVSRDLQCPRDGYFDRFVGQMGGHPGAGTDQKAQDDQRATVERYYWAQCLKDETMAESIAGAFEKQNARPGTIVHYTGAFHSDFGQGTAERVRRRLPGRRVAIVSMMPTGDLDRIDVDDEDLKRGDYLVFTIK
ncbi:MAG: hypothetical protein A3H96_04100 [Acidobacteria bacterium RIFCSPLOWO2_02_FULL_67_36]|nr:MAG: hypothetical protein A3H96_04100 [Acidobacteria bacterium RIFCSPLOWO2_02_FULL_67_36]OFW19693.1 MAG: hypothetical protein A3G21_12985 [Acidobacteria bacterium RIFCSPLOWO2_12_FULL_66_21]